MRNVETAPLLLTQYPRSGGGKRFAQRGVEMSPVIWIPDAHVSPDRRHFAADSARDEARLMMTVDRWKVAVRLTWQNDRLRLDAAERLREVAAIGERVADVAIHPGPYQRQQIVGVVMDEGWLPEIFDKLLGVPRAEHPIALRPIEGFGEAPSGINRGEGLETRDRRRLIEALGKGRITFDRAPEGDQEHLVERCSARRAAHGYDRVHHGGILSRPLERLATAHRPSRHQFEMIDFERLQ